MVAKGDQIKLKTNLIHKILQLNPFQTVTIRNQSSSMCRVTGRQTDR